MTTVLMPGTKLTVFAIHKTLKGATMWVRVGNGFVNKDASLNLWLDALPLAGQLHIRESVTDRRETSGPPANAQVGMVAGFDTGTVPATNGTGGNVGGVDAGDSSPELSSRTEFAAAGGHS
jgi:hypothetical protein